MKRYKLSEVAKVEISSVDKKTKDGETPVRLCNFTNVYHNWAITSDMVDTFMVASANPNEIEKFTIRKGQVAFTKDSETRDDIGIPTYIADDFEDVILGYHCALITPDETKLCGKYLNAFMHSAYIQRYFELNATGSGMRYTLSLDTLENMTLLLPSLEEQKRIGEIFSSLDKKISINRAINQNLEALAKQLYDYWFVQFDFPNEEGKPYKSSGGAMVWSEMLKKEIPANWDVKMLRDITNDGDIKQINPQQQSQKVFKHLSFPSFDACGSYFEETGESIRSNKTVVRKDYVLAAKLNPWIKRIAWGTEDEDLICSTEFVVLNPSNPNTKAFLYEMVNQDAFIEYCTTSSTGTSHSQRRVKPDIMKMYQFPYNKRVVELFSTQVLPLIEKSFSAIEQNKILIKQRDELLPLLMNGQVSLNSDLSVSRPHDLTVLFYADGRFGAIRQINIPKVVSILLRLLFWD